MPSPPFDDVYLPYNAMTAKAATAPSTPTANLSGAPVGAAADLPVDEALAALAVALLSAASAVETIDVAAASALWGGLALTAEQISVAMFCNELILHFGSVLPLPPIPPFKQEARSIASEVMWSDEQRHEKSVGLQLTEDAADAKHGMAQLGSCETREGRSVPVGVVVPPVVVVEETVVEVAEARETSASTERIWDSIVAGLRGLLIADGGDRSMNWKGDPEQAVY
jgi:hypothetical protein